MQRYQMPFLDSLILAEEAPGVEYFVTWARHYQGKASLTVLTPDEYLES